ncbi:MAG: hypothetical protein ACLGIS_16780, partial [Actinomycetes bacterium]
SRFTGQQTPRWVRHGSILPPGWTFKDTASWGPSSAGLTAFASGSMRILACPVDVLAALA